MIEPSVSRSLGVVALALELNESDFLAVLCRRSSGRSNLAEQPDRPTRLSGHCAAHSARVPMTGAVVVQCCAVLAGDGLAPAGRANGVLASVLAALLCCTVVCVTYVCIHEIERSLNFNLYNTDFLFAFHGHRARRRADALRPAFSTAPSLLKGLQRRD